MTRTSKTQVVALALCGSLLAGCYGQYAATRKIYTWNGNVSSNGIVRSALMWGLLIIPVYELCLLGDFLIFNPLELVTGSNPLAVNEGGSVETRYAGHHYLLRPTDEGKVEVLLDGKPSYRYRMAGRDFVVEDMAGQTVRVIDGAQQLARAHRPHERAVF